MRTFALAGVVVLGLLTATAPAEDTVVKVGQGSYALTPPAGAKQPSATVYKTDALRGPIPTNDWCSSLVFAKYSECQYPHPLAVKATQTGLRVYYPGTSIAANRIGIFGDMPDGGQDFVLGHSAQAEFPDARLHDFSDWFVTASFAHEGKRMLVSYGHGSPFVYAIYEGGEPRLTFVKKPAIWSGDARTPVLGVTLEGRHYGLFGPAGSTWSGLDTNQLTCKTGGKPYFAVAVLPKATPETLALFQRYAYTHVIGTKVEWAYEAKSSTVTERFAFTTKAHQGDERATLFALYPHQWRRTAMKLLDLQYDCVRGTMKLAAGTSFSTRRIYPGVLVVLPDMGTSDRKTLKQYIEDEAAAAVPDARDTYWTGKRLGKLAALVPIAEQVGAEAAKAKFLGEMKQRLEDWFTAFKDKEAKKSAGLFCYNRTWGTLIGYPASYGSDDQLNDHHFHYGYYIKAAAEVARHDPAWAARERWGGMVGLLIRDIASPKRNDERFPFLRNFDPYAGHSWASGTALFASGNNHESSSEAMNAWTGLILWGEATGDRAVRDLGIYLYTVEMDAIDAYWFDVYGANHRRGFTPSVVTMVWGGKGVNETWFSNKPPIVHGINWIPIHGGSLYLGRYPAYIRKNYVALVKENGGAKCDDWADAVLMYLALDDPRSAIRQFEERRKSLPIEAGNSLANLYHWLHTLDALGQVDRSVTADHPLYAVFRKGTRKTYIVHNMKGEPLTVVFSDGTTIAARRKGIMVETRLPERGGNP
jgi:endoglucanase Acf2